MTDFDSDHDAISDRMPDVAAGRARWSVSEARHLAVCVACRREWAIVHGAMRIGAGIEPALHLDEAAIARAVLGRLHQERGVGAGARVAAAMRRRIWAVAGAIGAAGLAAGLALFVRAHLAPSERPIAVAPARPAVAAPVRTAQPELSVPELDDVPPEALDTVLRSLDRPFKADEVLDANWGDVESREFERGFSTISTARK